ncbi:MAG: uracil-DNA glycosylase [Planctomycetes bacterium]|nr:uracil-DNA glycosylase [Planctomycetota bacterium]
MSARDAALGELAREIVDCARCRRLAAWRAEVARTRRAAFREESYWGRPVPGFGDPDARLVIVGLAPGAHGANRTGRVFTGDRSGEWLFAALHEAGFASQPSSTGRDDGMRLADAWITSALRCVPPGNRPERAEEDSCRPFLEREWRLLEEKRVALCLGGIAYGALRTLLEHAGTPLAALAPRFGHGVEIEAAPGRPALLLSYHPSQQNTFTGRLTRPMFAAVFARARELVER